MANDYVSVPIPMPNHIFTDLKEWVEQERLKNVHREFVYAYYWSLAFLWRTGQYHERGITQKDIKKQLGFNPDEKRINYIIKKNGLLDQVGYTEATRNYPVEWKWDDQTNLEVVMVDDFEEWQKFHMGIDDPPNYFVKVPLLHMGEEWDGLYWYSADSHMIRSEVFFRCMDNPNLGCAGFMLYGLLMMFRDKMMYADGAEWINVSNETIGEWTGWNLKKVKHYSNALRDSGLVSKWRKKREAGFVNGYKVNAFF